MFTKLPKALSNPLQVYILISGSEDDLLKFESISLASFLDNGAIPSSSRGLTMFVLACREPWLTFVTVRQQLFHLLHLSTHNYHLATNKPSSITSFIFKHQDSIQLTSYITSHITSTTNSFLH